VKWEAKCMRLFYGSSVKMEAEVVRWGKNCVEGYVEGKIWWRDFWYAPNTTTGILHKLTSIWWECMYDLVRRGVMFLIGLR